MIARIYKQCGRCGISVNSEDEIHDDDHGRGVCKLCLKELEMKRDLRWLRHQMPKCARCGKIKQRDDFSKYELQRWDRREDRMVFGVRKTWTPEIVCFSCQTQEHQKEVAESCESDIRRRAVKWLKRGTKLTERNLPENLIQTKITQMKVSNLWQSPKT